jgi:alcohol dehydrogenase class IV
MQALQFPEHIVIGGGSGARAADFAGQIGMVRPLIVTDSYLAKTNAIAPVVDSFSSPPAVFAETMAEPDSNSVDALVAVLKSGSHDGMIAVGGGSPIDSCKAASLLATLGGHMRDYKAPFQISAPLMPVIAIPTTAGTGSECTRFTVITDSATAEKMLCVGPSLMPRVALVDYHFTLTKPARLTADTGLDALTHAIEAYVSRKAGPFSDGLALQAMRTIYLNIRQVCAVPDDHQARAAMMFAATQAGMAFSNASVALVHGMSRPIGARFHVPHGLSNAMLLPAVTAFSISGAPDRYAQCAVMLGVSNTEQPVADACAALVGALTDLNRHLNVPTLAQFPISVAEYEAAIPEMVAQALASGSPQNNPRIPNVDEMALLYREAYGLSG